MSNEKIDIIETAFENIDNINANAPSDVISVIQSTIDDIDIGNVRVA